MVDLKRIKRRQAERDAEREVYLKCRPTFPGLPPGTADEVLLSQWGIGYHVSPTPSEQAIAFRQCFGRHINYPYPVDSLARIEWNKWVFILQKLDYARWDKALKAAARETDTEISITSS